MLDENLTAGLVPLLAALGNDVDTVPAEGFGGRDDASCGERRRRRADSR
jgi:hypothetical protein